TPAGTVRTSFGCSSNVAFVGFGPTPVHLMNVISRHSNFCRALLTSFTYDCSATMRQSTMTPVNSFTVTTNSFGNAKPPSKVGHLKSSDILPKSATSGPLLATTLRVLRLKQRSVSPHGSVTNSCYHRKLTKSPPSRNGRSSIYFKVLTNLRPGKVRLQPFRN